MKKILMALIVGLFVVGFSSLSFADTIAYTSFEEPSIGSIYTDTGSASTNHALLNNTGEADVNFTPGGGDNELGFSSYYYNTRNDVGLTDGDYVGVTSYTGDVGSYPDGNNGFEMSDCDGLMETTLSAVSLSGYTSQSVSIKYFLKATGWESDDELRIWIVVDGGAEVDIINTAGSDIDDLGIEGSWQTGNTDLSSYTTATLKFSLDCNSGSEAVFFDYIVFSGTPTGGVADPTSFTATTSSVSQIALSWTQNGSSDDVMVAWTSDGVFGTPIDGTSYSAGNSITGGGTVLYNGSNTSYNHISLNSNTQYFYKAWSVDGSDNYSSGVTDDATTYKDEPSNHVTGFGASANGWSKIDLSWTENDGSVVPDGYLIKASTSDNVSNPVDGTPVADNTTIGNDSGAINLSHGTTSYQWTGLNEESTYYFKIYPYTNSGSAIDYKTVGTVPSANATTGEKPAVPYVFFSEYIEGTSNNKAIEIYNGSLSTIDLSDYAVKLASNGGGWGTTENLSGNLASGDVYVIYNSGASSGITDVGDLASSVTYFNGNDALGLFYSDFLIDVIGEPDNDPGTAWSVAGTSNATAEHTLVRKYAVTSGNTDWSASAGTTTENSEWIVYAQDTFSYLGSHNGQTLPIILSTFTAQYLNSKPTLYWQTQSEEDNMGWFIYRNTIEDFTSAEKITGMIEGHGTTTQPQSYIYEDAEELQVEQTYYYWLESVDYSGTIHHYDRVAQVTIPHPNDPGQNVTPPVAYDITADPNPFSHTTEITFAIDQISRVDVSIYNIKGELVKSFNTVITNADEEVSFQWNGKDNAGKTLSNGVYLYSVKVNGNDYATKQLILMK